jgi:hypothetical protein
MLFFAIIKATQARMALVFRRRFRGHSGGQSGLGTSGIAGIIGTRFQQLTASACHADEQLALI